MPVRRLSAHPVVVLTGVENSGKTTLAAALAEKLGWPLVAEAARTDEAVLSGRPTAADLQRLLQSQCDAIDSRTSSLLLDTGPLVLDLWSQAVFATPLEGVAAAMDKVDLFILCRTLPDWEPDPLRTLPHLRDRQDLEARYVARLRASGRPWLDLPVEPTSARLAAALDAIQSPCP